MEVRGAAGSKKHVPMNSPNTEYDGILNTYLVLLRP
jgi:hypothetical protein